MTATTTVLDEVINEQPPVNPRMRDAFLDALARKHDRDLRSLTAFIGPVREDEDEVAA